MRTIISIIFISMLFIFSCNEAEVKNSKKTNKSSNTTSEVVEKKTAEKVNTEKVNTENDMPVGNPKNIKDYFLLLPDKLINNLSLEQRKFMLQTKEVIELIEKEIYFSIDTLDYKNAYMRISGLSDGEGQNIELTYFVKSDKSKLIAVNITQWDMVSEVSSLNFYTYNNSKWTNVTSEVIPKIDINSFVNKKVEMKSGPIKIILPQNGKTIKVDLDMDALSEWINKKEYSKIKNNLSCTNFDLLWRDGTFVVGNKTMGKNRR